jgi:hypothetical protein
MEGTLNKWVRLGVAALFLISISTVPVYAQHGGGGKGGSQAKQQAGPRKPSGGDNQQHAAPRSQERPQGVRPATTGRQADRQGKEAAPSQAKPDSRSSERAVARPRENGQSSARSSERPAPATRGTVAGKAEPRGGRYPAEVRSARTVREWQDRRAWQGRGAWSEHKTFAQHRAVRWDRDHRTWAQRGGYGGFFIPPGHFRLYFGPAHFFRIRTRPVIVMGYPRFHYGGYWFMLVDPWPEFWADDWYDSDEVYVDYDDGYYLHNRRHPGVAIAISVVL